jgi:hypothetical protein
LKEKSEHKNFKDQVTSIYKLLLVFFTFLIVVVLGFSIFLNEYYKEPIPENYTITPVEVDEDLIENGIHVRTGFVEGEGLMAVINNCTNCHSAKLVTQNRMSKEGWIATIQWMQETQNLWDLGGNEEVIVNYLAVHYAPMKKGRREGLTNIEWYELEN